MSLRRTTKALMRKIDEMNHIPYSAEEVRSRMGISTMSLMTDGDKNLGVDEQALRQAVEVGARKIEIGADFGPSHFPYHNRAATKELKRFYNDCGAQIYSIHSPYGSNPLEWGLEDARQLIEAMALVEAKILVMHFVFWGQAQWQPTLEVLNELVEMCKPYGIWLSIETDTDMSFDSHFVDWFEFPQVGICCDTAHSGVHYGELNILSDPGNAISSMSTANGKLNHLHLSDVSLTPLPRAHARLKLGNARAHWSPGRGDSHWAAIFLALKAMDYPGCFMFEIWTEDEQRFESLATFPERLMAGELGQYIR